MAKRTVGYVDLEWTCPRCGSRNLGVDKKCASCGAAQPQDVQFGLGAPSGALIEDEAKIQQAQSGPDIHCPYCGARNAAGAQRCKICGGALEGAEARQAGQVLGALPTGAPAPVTCPACGAQNAASAMRCESCGATLPNLTAPPPPAAAKPAQPARRLPIGLIAVAGILLAAACLAIVLLAGGNRGGGPTQQAAGQVIDTNWKRTILLQALVPVRRQDWRPNIPADATLGSCNERLYRTLDEPVSGSVEVCGTPYVVDTGTGVGEVVQECQYQVFEDYCDYTALGWQAIAPLVVEGQGLNPAWSSQRLSDQQRETGRNEEYVVTFQTEDGPVRYTVPSLQRFQQFTQGSRWNLEIDSRGRVVAVEPAP